MKIVVNVETKMQEIDWNSLFFRENETELRRSKRQCLDATNKRISRMARDEITIAEDKKKHAARNRGLKRKER